MAKLFENCGDPDQMVHSAASDMGLHCMQITLYGGLQTKVVNGCAFSYCGLIAQRGHSLLGEHRKFVS